MAELIADPSNTITMFSSKTFDDSIFNNLEYWFKINYRKDKFTDAQLQFFSQPIQEESSKFGLPEKNKLVPQNVEVLPFDSEFAKYPLKIA